MTGSSDSVGAPPVSLQTASTLDVAVKWTDELRIYGEGFVGRKEELAALDRAWTEGVRIFLLHAEGGAGKTRVVVEWLRRMRDAGWCGARRVFVHSFYSQGSDDRRNASSDLLFEQALAFFGYRGEPITQADERGRILARLLIEQHGLLILDGLEPLQHPIQHAERGRLKDPGIKLLLTSLANFSPDVTRALCLITSLQPVAELQTRTGKTVIQQALDKLRREDGEALLRQFEVVGPEEELRTASDEFHGHAYSLMLLGSFLRNATNHHDIRRRREVVLLEEDTEQGGHAREMLAAHVRLLGEHSREVATLRLLGFFDRAAESQLFDVLRARKGVVYRWSKEGGPAEKRLRSKCIEDSLAEVTAPLLDLSQEQWFRVCTRLRDLRLIDLTGPSTSPAIGAHPLLREFFAEQVRTQFPAAWKAGHRRLFEQLEGTTPYWPEGIEGLQPLYQAVSHGCRAGLHRKACREVFRKRILRGTGDDGFYSTLQLGAIGADLEALACFFATPWITVAPTLSPVDQAWLLSQAAYHLRALGRLTEAAVPMRAALEEYLQQHEFEDYIQQHEWDAAVKAATNLNDLELTRGEVAAAITVGEQSVAYADSSQDAYLQAASRSILANALHQAGRYDEARRLFEDAEIRQAANQPQYPRLYTSVGSYYCDLLLSEVERLAWQGRLSGEALPSERLTAAIAACAAVGERASQTLAWVKPTNALLDIAFDHLSLARAAFYKALLTPRGERLSSVDYINAAVDGLRAAGDIPRLPRGLLTRAWIRCLSGDEPGARADLDEAWEIAERGPMPLFQADIHLYRARLFRDRAALAEARRLIEKHGYHRRDGELADALAAAEGW